jgi:hypothetical protein
MKVNSIVIQNICLCKLHFGVKAFKNLSNMKFYIVKVRLFKLMKLTENYIIIQHQKIPNYFRAFLPSCLSGRGNKLG